MIVLMRAGLVSAVRQSLFTLVLAAVTVWTFREQSSLASWPADCTKNCIALGLGLADLLTAAAVVATSNNAVHATEKNLAQAAALTSTLRTQEVLTRLLVMLVLAAAASAVATISGPPTWISAMGDRLAPLVWSSVLSVAFAFFCGYRAERHHRSASVNSGSPRRHLECF